MSRKQTGLIASGMLTVVIGFAALTANPFVGPFGSGRASGGLTPAGSLCLNGSCSVYLTATDGGATLVGAPLSSTEGFTDGTLASAQNDLYANTFVSTGFSADGGTGGYAAMCNGPSCAYKLAEGSSMDMVAGANSVTFNVGDVTLPTTYISAIANRTGSNLYFYNDPGKWTYFFPTTDTTGCAAGTAGGFRFRSTDSHHVACVGAGGVETVAYQVSATVSVDFGSMLLGAEDSQTVTLTGAVTGNYVSCQPTTSLAPGLIISYSYVSGADTVKVTAYNGSGGVLNPVAADYRCVVVR